MKAEGQKEEMKEDITLDWLRENHPKLAEWMINLKLEIMKCALINVDDGGQIHIRLYTNKHIYRISASVKKDYLGCTAVTRKARTGEEHNRGNDLADGKYTEETWNKILKDIVMYELETLEVK